MSEHRSSEADAHHSLGFKSCRTKGSRESEFRRTGSTDTDARSEVVLGTNRSASTAVGSDAMALRTPAEFAASLS